MAQSTIILADSLIDGVDGQVRPGQGVCISAGRITAVEDREALLHKASPETETLDLGAVYLAPGLIDGHTHASLAGDGRTYAEMFDDADEFMLLTGVMNLRKHLLAGITTMREHGARNRVVWSAIIGSPCCKQVSVPTARVDFVSKRLWTMALPGGIIARDHNLLSSGRYLGDDSMHPMAPVMHVPVVHACL